MALNSIVLDDGVTSSDRPVSLIRMTLLRENSMAGYVILDIHITDEALHAEFRQRVGPLVEARGGKFLIRGEVVETIGFELTAGHRMVVMEFETIEQAREWPTLPQHLPEYAELREIRDRSAKVNTIIVEGN